MRKLAITDYKEAVLTDGDKELMRFPVSCNVRTLANKKRRKDEVVRSIPNGQPYDPVQFPLGTWSINGIEWRKDYGFDAKVYGDVKIRTNAKIKLPVWELDRDGDYERMTGEVVDDSGYLLHWAPNNTLGCINLLDKKIAAKLGELLHSGDILEVT
jgi:hypothetical protein